MWDITYFLHLAVIPALLCVYLIIIIITAKVHSNACLKLKGSVVCACISDAIKSPSLSLLLYQRFHLNVSDHDGVSHGESVRDRRHCPLPIEPYSAR